MAGRSKRASAARLGASQPRPAITEARFEHVFDAALDVLLLIDPDSGAILRANRAVERLLGYPAGDLAGRHFSVLFPPPRWATPAELLAQTRVPGGHFVAQEFRAADGSIRAMDLGATLTAWGMGHVILATLRDASERASAEAALRETQERLELVLHGADLGLWDWNLESGVVTFNDRAAAIVGYAREELAGDAHGWEGLLHPDDRARALAAIRAHHRQETPAYECEFRLRHKRGGWVWVLNRGKFVRRDARGRGLRATGTLFDVSERRRSEEERAALLEMATELTGTLDLRAMLESVQRRAIAALPIDVVMTIYWEAESAAYRLIAQSGLSAGQAEWATGASFAIGDLFDGVLGRGETLVVDDPGAWGAAERELLASLGVGTLAAVPLLVRGQVRGVFCAGQRRRSPFSARDIHFAENIARQLAVAVETAALYRAQQEDAHYSSALARVGRELIAVLATPAVNEQLCRVACAELGCDVGLNLLWSERDAAYVPTASHGTSAEYWAAVQVVRLSRERAAGLIEAFGATGLVRFADLDADDPVRRALCASPELRVGALVALRHGEDVVGFLAAGWGDGHAPFDRQQERIARGIAQVASLALDNTRLVEELERANRIKSDFVATMSHELRTPLNVIIGYHDLLLDGEFGPLEPAQAERLRSADQSARELLDLINATLDLSRLETRRVALDVQDIDLRALMAAIATELGTARRKPGVRFIWDVATPAGPLRSDPVKLKVVLKNLIQNAFKFTDAGAVTVRVTRAPDRVEFAVSDTGIGIPPEHLETIFEPFRQLDSSSTRSYGGVGLGLYIVARLLDLLGGGIRVESEVGRGSTFRVWVPDRAG